MPAKGLWGMERDIAEGGCTARIRFLGPQP